MLKSRTGSKGNASHPPPQSIEAVRRRAKHRLIGACVLVLVGVIGFPLLFDTQPRPISVDIPIDIPAKNATAPLVASRAAQSSPAGAPAAVETPEAKDATPPKAALSTQEGLGEREQVVEPVRSAASVQPDPKPAAPPPAKTPSVEKPRADDKAEAARAQALLEGKKTPGQAAGAERVVVQVGAFAEAAGARTVRLKLERAGLKTYTHVAETSAGKRIRVRLGPFDNRAEAEKAAAKVKALGLPAAILTL